MMIQRICITLKTSSCGMFLSDSDKLRVVAETMANPEGAKAGEPYQNPDGGRFSPVVS